MVIAFEDERPRGLEATGITFEDFARDRFGARAPFR